MVKLEEVSSVMHLDKPINWPSTIECMWRNILDTEVMFRPFNLACAVNMLD